MKKNIRLKSFIISLLLIALFSLAFTVPKNDEPIKIGFCIDNLILDRWSKDLVYFIEKTHELEGKVLLKVANSSPSTQIKQAKALINKNVDVLVIVPVDGQSAAKIVEMAHAADIKVIAYDRIIKNCDLDYYISYDNVKVGELQAQYAINLKPKGNYLIIDGPGRDNNSLLFKEGQMNILKPLINSGDINLIYNKSVPNWSETEAMLIMEDFLNSSQKRPDVVIAANDALASGALMALQNHDAADSVIITGQDAEINACRRILNNQQTMTVYKSIKNLAYTTAETAILAAKNKKIKNINTKIDNGKTKVPAILLTPIVVDKNNIQTVIDDDYWTKEEIYD